jgi:hypothetical protein
MLADFRFYLAYTLKLCAATVEFGNDSKEADEIRNAMDTHAWWRLTDKQQQAIRALSAKVNDLEDGVVD